MPWLIKTWKELSDGKPFLIKGIQCVSDAQKCVDIGCDGIVVSNHAGRQVDGAVASLDALEAIIDAGIGEKLTVTFDSGVRGASDVIKALCLGAKFVWIGRLWVWGLSIMGEEGVRHVMKSLWQNLILRWRWRFQDYQGHDKGQVRQLRKGLPTDRGEVEALIKLASTWCSQAERGKDISDGRDG